MDPNPQEPTISPSGSNPPPPPPKVDPRSLVLPTKEVHDPLNAQRASAGFLAAQEASAVLPKMPPPPPLPHQTPAPDSVRPLETYQSDVEKFIQEQNVSGVSAAAAEELRRRKTERTIKEPPMAPTGTKSKTFQFVAIIGGVILIVGAIGGVIFAFVRSRPLQQQQMPIAPFIAIDSTSDVQLKPEDTRADIMKTLETAKEHTDISIGLIAQLRLWMSATTGTTLVQSSSFFSIVTPNIPQQLLQTIQPQFLLGVHSFDINQPFLIFSVDSYQSGYAGMLAWETNMQQDLLPLFGYTPAPHTSNLQTTTTPPPTPQILASPFVDDIIENHDARVIKNQSGDIVFLWTFLDNSTILITTNPSTVREIVTRVKNPPQMVVPGQ